MKENTKRMLVAFAAACMVFTATFAAAINWKPVNGDWNGDFGDVNHWEGEAVPGSGDEAVFPATSSKSFTVTVTANYSIGKLTMAHYDSAGRKITLSGSG